MKLEPCPCCGSRANQQRSCYLSGQNFFLVRCIKCGLQTREFKNVVSAVKNWNKRVDIKPE